MSPSRSGPTRDGTGASGRPDAGSQVATAEGGGPVGDPVTPPISDPTARRLSQRVKDYPQDLAAQFDYQAFLLAQGETVPQLPTLAGLSGEDRELLAALMDGLSNFRNAVRADGNLLLSRKVHPILDLSDRLRAQAELTIPTLALCRKVDTFGVYEPIQPTRLHCRTRAAGHCLL